MRDDLLKRATDMAADLRGEDVHAPDGPVITDLVNLSDSGADALSESRGIAKSLVGELPGFISRTSRFVSGDGATVLSKASESVAALVDAFARLYDSGAVPSGSQDQPPQARMVSGGAALSKALVGQLSDLTDPSLPDSVRKAIDSASADLSALIDLSQGLTGLDGDRAGLEKSEIQSDLPLSMRGKRRAILQLHAIGKSLHADFRFEKSADHLVGWTFDLAKSVDLIGDVSDVEVLKKTAAAWSPYGMRGFDSMTAPASVGAVPKSKHPSAWLTMKSEVVAPGEAGASADDAGVIVAVDEPTLEFGLQSEDRHEYFLSDGKTAGRLVVKSDGDEWAASLETSDLLPDVLRPAAVLEKRMPPDGTSGLPQSLEVVVPASNRFWLAKGDDARAMRDELVESGFMTGGVLLIDREMRLVEKSMRLVPEATGPATGMVGDRKAALLKKMEGMFPDGTRRIVVVGKVDNRERLEKQLSGFEGEVIFYDLPDADSLTPTIEHLAKSASDYIVGADDTPEAREALGSIGQMFSFPLTIEKRIFAASFPVPPNLPGVRWVSKATAKAKVAAMSERSKKAADVVRKMRFVRPTSKAEDEEEEERFILAIVLEPDEVDSQSDTYDADEIRKVAHTFMTDFQALGVQHSEFAADRMQLLESYLAPADFDIEKSDGETQTIKLGTWLMGIRFVDDELWRKVKDGEITGLSIGGSAVRTPETSESSS